MAHLLDTFEGADWQDELVVPLATYAPWGSDEWDGYYTTSELGRLLEGALPSIDREAIA
jgi:hypothetical protein